MSVFESIILGIIQGLTEFLPVSSSGHLVIAQKLMNLPSEDLTASVLAHFGTLLAVVFFYKKEFAYILRTLFDRKTNFLVNPSLRLIVLVVIAVIPGGLVGLFLKDFFEQYLFSSTHWVGVFLLVTAVILWASKSKTKDMEYRENFIKSLSHEMTFTKALIIGCSQALAICPGLSRSGTTITTSLFLGVQREQAAFFSFLISIPLILGALILELGQVKIDASQVPALLGIFISALIFGLIGLLGVTRILNRGLLYIFSFYLVPLGILVLFFL
ncbi:MAG: undecaprenyl-diphosphate phosphatase [Bdellovibrionaceae bacterium]|nr:undecaprenyl-diphosphate phosphatase [Pseudobdellovibrionaceae bacterium]